MADNPGAALEALTELGFSVQWSGLPEDKPRVKDTEAGTVLTQIRNPSRTQTTTGALFPMSLPLRQPLP